MAKANEVKRAPVSNSKQLAAFFGNNLPAKPADTAKNLAALGSQRQNRLTKPLLKFTKTGEWLAGVDQDELDDGTKLAINPNSFRVGYICWNDSEVSGEKMVPLGQPLTKEQLPNVEGDWQAQVSAEFASLKANRDGSRDEFIFKTSSMGGHDAMMDLAAALAEAIEDNEGLIPVVTLGSTSYKHKKFGTVHKPELELVEWISPK